MPVLHQGTELVRLSIPDNVPQLSQDCSPCGAGAAAAAASDATSGMPFLAHLHQAERIGGMYACCGQQCPCQTTAKSQQQICGYRCSVGTQIPLISAVSSLCNFSELQGMQEDSLGAPANLEASLLQDILKI